MDSSLFILRTRTATPRRERRVSSIGNAARPVACARSPTTSTFVAIPYSWVSFHNTGNKDIPFRYKIINIHPVSFRDKTPAIKGGAEKTCSGINRENLDIIFTVKKFRIVPPARCAFRVRSILNWYDTIP